MHTWFPLPVPAFDFLTDNGQLLDEIGIILALGF